MDGSSGKMMTWKMEQRMLVTRLIPLLLLPYLRETKILAIRRTMMGMRVMVVAKAQPKIRVTILNSIMGRRKAVASRVPTPAG